MIDRISGMRRNFLIGTGLAGIAAFTGAQPVLAQDSDTAAEERSDQLDTIIVTANRREENLQDVAVSAATLQPARVQNIFAAGADNTALSGQVPGLNVESSNGRAAPRFYIRGLGNTDFDLAASQPVSVVMDDIVLENVTLKSFPIFDVERVEVLRGPQGTLFGRNTPAGIVKIDTKKPSQEFSAHGSVSVGSYMSTSAELAAGGPVIEDILAARFALLYQHRDDWVDNGFTGENDVYGGFDDLAVRGQILVTPDDRFSALASIQYRNLEGTSTLFRANVLGPGTNDLNANYDRDTVYYDAGGGNKAAYRMWGASLNMDYDFDFATLTSITGYYHSQGSSRGDIDGGNLVTGPGFIPFPSDTQDSIDLDQFTHELRLASDDTQMFSWQIGGYYFWSDFDVTTVGFTFPPPVTVRHKNEAWAVFGQGTVKLSDMLKVTAGIRYTDDEKDFYVRNAAPNYYRAVGDNRISWDVSLFADVATDVSLYTRVASGFRAPTIQGRDVAFFNPPSVAQSEKIMSYEAGFKTELADRRIRLNGAAFYYEVEDPQFSAVGGAGNLVQLVNANKGRGYGFELDSAFKVTPFFEVTAGLSYNDTKIEDPNLLVGVCAQCTVTDPLVGGFANVDGNPFPNAPEWTADVTARLGLPVGDAGEFFIYTDWTYQGATNYFLYESLEFNSNSQFEGGLRIGYSGNYDQWEIAAFARNITNEDNIKGGIDFNNNTAFVNEPRVIGVSLGFRY